MAVLIQTVPLTTTTFESQDLKTRRCEPMRDLLARVSSSGGSGQWIDVLYSVNPNSHLMLIFRFSIRRRYLLDQGQTTLYSSSLTTAGLNISHADKKEVPMNRMIKELVVDTAKPGRVLSTSPSPRTRSNAILPPPVFACLFGYSGQGRSVRLHHLWFSRQELERGV